MTNAMNNLTFDHIDIGAGTAGCLLANRLRADPKRRVLLWRPAANRNLGQIPNSAAIHRAALHGTSH